jgi:ketosteroid isomerase-like protein
MGEMGMSQQQQQQQNKKLIQEGFDRWASNQGSFFDLLSDDIEWTITRTSPISKTYTSRKQFLDEVIAPLSARLSKQITPKVRALYADGDTVIALWDGTAVAKDGKPYNNNTYSWYMTLKNDRIVKAIAFFDTLELANIWERIPI